MSTPSSKEQDKRPLVVSFVIPALNEERFVERCLRSIDALERPTVVSRVEVIVVDNQSTDRTVEISRGYGATVVSCPPGRPSRARNLGAAAASGDWLAFIDADCELAGDWLTKSIQALSACDVVAVGGRVLPPPSVQGWVAKSAGGLFYPAADGECHDAAWLTTQGFMVSTAVFKMVGGFDESLTTCEDCELGYRLAEHGRLVHNPAAELIHHGESTTLREVFCREAWRSSDNLRLAFTRPADLRNWLSVLLPVVFAALVAVAVVGVSVSLAIGGSPLVWLVVGLAGVLLPPVMTLLKNRGPLTPASLLGRSIVLATYFFGRAIGPVWRFARVER